jgi:hypothetical protein
MSFSTPLPTEHADVVTGYTEPSLPSRLILIKWPRVSIFCVGHTNMVVAGRMLCCGKKKALIYNKTEKYSSNEK